jgi:hypothetical protein
MTVPCKELNEYEMDRVPPPAQEPANLVRVHPFSLDRLLSHIDPGPVEETESFVRLISEQRHVDVSSEHNVKTSD